MKQIVFWILFFTVKIGCAQAVISGKVSDSLKIPISGVSVVVNVKNTDSILAYDITNGQGDFSIAFTSEDEMVDVVAKSMGFATFKIAVVNKSQTLNFTLKEQVTELKEVVVKSSPITQKGDTINYNVSSFAKQEDRSIADVIKNMPGIEVLSDGQILYQGKPINKYYIEGLDLLEGKYNLANNNLPHAEVSQVQILENHQPIKILDSLVYSDRAALNIKLKNSYTFTGQAEIGSGASPLLRKVNITPMLFSKKQQMLTSYQTNNTGENVASQLKKLTIEDLLDQFERNDTKEDWLAIQPIEQPVFKEQRWLDNNVHLLTFNFLQKLKNDYELRVNTSHLNDYQQQRGYTDTRYFVNADTVMLLEQKYNQLYSNSLETIATLQKNTKENYFKNSLKFNGYWDGQRGTVELTDENVNQNLSNKYFRLSNDFKVLFPLGKQIATLKSYVAFSKVPQSLSVMPGQFSGLLNNGASYNEVVQDVVQHTFYTNNFVEFSKGWKNFSFNPKVGFLVEKQQLDTEILTSETLQTSNFQNNLDWFHTKLYFHLKTQYKVENWRVELSSPINYNRYVLEDKPLDEAQELSKVTFEPRLSLKYDVSGFWSLGTSSGLSNSFGTINQVYYNYILQNYRNIQRIDAPLPVVRNLNYSFFVNYRNPISALFFNVIYNYSNSKNNLLYESFILDNGAVELQAVPQNNYRDNHNLSFKGSKYFSDISTNLTFGTRYGLQSFQQLLNSELTDVENQNWQFNGKIDIDITDWLNTELSSVFQYSNSKIQQQKNKTIAQQFHELNINLYPSKNHYVGLNTEYVSNNLYSKTDTNLFADVVYKYTWQKKNVDFGLRWSNIFNTENYNTVNVSEYSYVATRFNLRPQQLLLSVKFSL
ncbi:carboxypeptidase-like regulatory domain-containing protein [Joostella sp. CR20]|uniref:carboxypeptidase-like regulatory domain-containing protein n=1 Tax=Joostella sp. CR20 TaxID=2804312 RepID=UPI00313E2400